MTYRELYNQVKKTKIIPAEEQISYEVADELSTCYRGRTLSDEKFNEACSLIKETYLKYESISIYAVTEALIKISKEDLENFDFDSITRRELADEACYQ